MKLTAAVRQRVNPYTPGSIAFRRRRRALAERYLAGDGIEIGALHRPLYVPAAARVKYVDRIETPELRQHYPELARDDLVDVDIVDDGETLPTVPDGSLDFVIANHFIEHTEDPLGTLGHHLRVLRPGGILFMAVPNRERTFDSKRQPTPFDHVLRDHREGPEWSRRTHYKEWVCQVIGLAEEQADEAIESLDAMKYSIHFHVWNPQEFAELLEGAQREVGLRFEIVESQINSDECIFILRRP